jgi:vitamin B12 transporter
MIKRPITGRGLEQATRILPVAFAIIAISLAAVFGSAPSFASQRIHDAPVAIIEDSPLSAFSDRAGLWPSTEIAGEALLPELGANSSSINSIPGLQSRQIGSPTLSIRGSALAARSLVLLDGMRLNMADGLGASSLLIPSESIGSVRLFKGPASAFYGTAGMAGALDYRTRRFSRPALRVSAADDSGSLGTQSAFLVLPLQSQEKNSESLISNRHAQLTLFTDHQPNRDSIRSSLSGANERRKNSLRDTTRGTLSASLAKGPWKIQASALAARSRGETPGPITAPMRSTFDLSGSIASLEISHTLAQSSRLSLRLADSRLDGLYDVQTDLESKSFASRTGASVDALVLASERATVRTYLDGAIDSIKADWSDPRDMSESNVSIGQSWEIGWTPNIIIQPTLLYNVSSRRFFPAVGLISFTDQARLWLTGSQGYRAPSLSDRFAQVSYFKGNPSLKAEHSSALEFGFTHNQGPLSLGGAVFWVRYDDLIDSREVATTNPLIPSASTLVNDGSARTFGGEFSINFNYREWMLGSAYHQLDARSESKDEPLRLAPRHQLSLTLSRKIGSITVEIKETAWSSFYDRAFPTNELRELSGWSTLDLTARASNLNDWEFLGGVLNVLDQPFELTPGYPEPQRRFFVSVQRWL